MSLRIVALGHRMPAWVNAGYEEYAKRLPREWALTLVELKPEPRDRGRAVPQLLAAEAVRLAAACAGAAIVVLDERGSLWTTRQLADNLQQWREGRTDVAFVIGSADGLDAGFKRSATARVALSAMTLPHGLVRVVLAEQLYRAASFLAGHPYHRE
ncbi:MAG TPA: 23S rRNA (pseudouridine(1915)-N(3))-methyltransferase RlmH [Casimicrobiaceae bacterium]